MGAAAGGEGADARGEPEGGDRDSGKRAELARLFARVEAIGRGFREFWRGQVGRTVLLELDLHALDGVVLPIAIVGQTAADRPLDKDVRFYLDQRPLELRAGNGHG